MAKKHAAFEQENARMFASLEKVAGKVEQRISSVKTLEQENRGLKFEIDNLKEEKEKLKRQLSVLKKDKDSAEKKARILDALEEQNFTIKNKIAKIVSDIDSEEISEIDVRELIQMMIGEIDECIRLLQK
ncbi:hypothetical protein [Jiulongibacter sediminis]|jgi:predicted RNase H-like nuclease (RuvC/YqgF family)|uniref:Uncharacterized protein n=1 Tax=Jiulongibacter sediminis TaxID=1605367 RepID=A0A0P7BPY3_9BACT|nr:hypothetical protein [Jiulongibacter sediminis]KPM49193.1 hypothetical protein AFM12_00665 [Jiulongibacter sediminis]TBX26247.1 hypothetical protein TK44_00665 [Jiulongibacter sediminis]